MINLVNKKISIEVDYFLYSLYSNPTHIHLWNVGYSHLIFENFLFKAYSKLEIHRTEQKVEIFLALIKKDFFQKFPCSYFFFFQFLLLDWEREKERELCVAYFNFLFDFRLFNYDKWRQKMKGSPAEFKDLILLRDRERKRKKYYTKIINY